MPASDLERYGAYLTGEKHASQNTVTSYLRDVKQFETYLQTDHHCTLREADNAMVTEYMNGMLSRGKSAASVTRYLASVKSFYNFLVSEQILTVNPARGVAAAKVERRYPEILTSKEVELFLEQPQCVDAKGYRDHAMLELLYATGIRVSELISLNLEDLNLAAGFLRCANRGKERMIPLYHTAVKALSDYVRTIRPQLIADSEETALFVNMSGERMSRQGFWKVLKGYAQSIRLLKKIKPDVVFSKGGFVSVPVVLAAKHCKVPAIIHESDLTPGLANKLAIPSATKVCCNFPETLSYLPKEKAVLTGSPIRQELLTGNADFAFSLCHFKDHSKQTILIVGGSSGSRVINTAIRGLLPELLKNYNVIHLCGKGNLDDTLTATDGYAQFEYANKELSDMFALADLVISRAGANAICELLALRKPNILIPLSAAASRGDQILNANSFRSQGFSYVLEEEELSNTTLLEAIEQKEAYIEAMENSNSRNSIDTIIGLILDASKK